MSLIFFFTSMCIVTVILAVFSEPLIDIMAPQGMDKLRTQEYRGS